jgi:RNA recognition motif-containing protein
MAEDSFPVWVGNLAFEATESMLLDLFSKFGPVNNITILKDDNGQSKQCAIVSFCSYEVGEAAAIALNGCDVFGQIIETRGHSKLKITSQPLSVSNKEKQDGNVLLDCLYFVENKNCPFKAGQVIT